MDSKFSLLTTLSIIAAIVLIVASFDRAPLKDAFTIIAIILGPIIALRLESSIQEKKKKTDVKKSVFRTLLATRRYPDTTLPDHYRALNTVYMDFAGSKKVSNRNI